MAFTVTARHSSPASESETQTRTTDSQTPSANSLLLVFWGSQRANHTTAEVFQTPTGGGWTYTQRQITDAFSWENSAQFSSRAAFYSAPVSGSPSAHTITVDSWSGTQLGSYTTVCCDVTGHDAGSPIAQTAHNGESVNPSGSSPGSVTLGSTPAVGNLVVVHFAAGDDAGDGFTAPTFGGQPMTELFSQAGTWIQSGLWYRVVTGAESSNTITCPQVGDDVGNWVSIAVEIAAEGDVATDLDGADTTQAQTATSAALTQTHELIADATVQAQTATAAALTQTHELAAGSAAQAQTATAAALTQVHELQPSSATQEQTATAPALTQTDELAATDTAQAQSATAATLTQVHELQPSSAVQGQSAIAAALVQVHELAATNVVQAQSAGVAAVTEGVTLIPSSAVQAQSATEVHVFSPTPLRRWFPARDRRGDPVRHYIRG